MSAAERQEALAVQRGLDARAVRFDCLRLACQQGGNDVVQRAAEFAAFVMGGDDGK